MNFKLVIVAVMLISGPVSATTYSTEHAQPTWGGNIPFYTGGFHHPILQHIFTLHDINIGVGIGTPDGYTPGLVISGPAPDATVMGGGSTILNYSNVPSHSAQPHFNHEDGS